MRLICIPPTVNETLETLEILDISCVAAMIYNWFTKSFNKTPSSYTWCTTGIRQEFQEFQSFTRYEERRLIYFIQDQATLAIKIGCSSDPQKRLEGLQTSSPSPLKLLATTVGDFKEEKELHERFEDHRLTGEWFKPHDNLLEEIQAINDVANALSFFTKSDRGSGVILPELCYLTSHAVQHYVTICECGGLYQIFRWDDSPGPGFEFWNWYSVVKAPMFRTPEEACVAYVAGFVEWHKKGQPLP